MHVTLGDALDPCGCTSACMLTRPHALEASVFETSQDKADTRLFWHSGRACTRCCASGRARPPSMSRRCSRRLHLIVQSCIQPCRSNAISCFRHDCVQWSGVRATLGITGGRHYFRVKVLQPLPVPANLAGPDTGPVHLARVGPVRATRAHRAAWARRPAPSATAAPALSAPVRALCSAAMGK